MNLLFSVAATTMTTSQLGCKNDFLFQSTPTVKEHLRSIKYKQVQTHTHTHTETQECQYRMLNSVKLVLKYIHVSRACAVWQTERILFRRPVSASSVMGKLWDQDVPSYSDHLQLSRDTYCDHVLGACCDERWVCTRCLFSLPLEESTNQQGKEEPRTSASVLTDCGLPGLQKFQNYPEKQNSQFSLFKYFQ